MSLLQKYFKQSDLIESNDYMRNNLTSILEEIRNLFHEDQLKNNDCTTLYDILCLVNKYDSKYKFITDNYGDIFNTLLKRIYPNSNMYIKDYDFNNKILNISFTNNNRKESIFIGVNEYNKFYVINNTKYGNTVLGYIENYLFKLYSDLDKFKGFKTEHSYLLKSSNSKFRVDINNHSVKLYYRVIRNQRLTDFEIKKDIFNKNYTYNCNSTEILDITQGHEKELFNRVFVKIEDCPEWSKSLLCDLANSGKSTPKSKIKALA